LAIGDWRLVWGGRWGGGLAQLAGRAALAPLPQHAASRQRALRAVWLQGRPLPWRGKTPRLGLGLGRGQALPSTLLLLAVGVDAVGRCRLLYCTSALSPGVLPADVEHWTSTRCRRTYLPLNEDYPVPSCPTKSDLSIEAARAVSPGTCLSWEAPPVGSLWEAQGGLLAPKRAESSGPLLHLLSFFRGLLENKIYYFLCLSRASMSRVCRFCRA
jgi:hypothetical protein